MPTLPRLEKDSVILPEFDDLSADLRYRLVRRWQRHDWAITALASCCSLVILATLAVPPLNKLVETKLRSLLAIGYIDNQVSDSTPPEFAAPVEKGDMLAGYAVTSGYGPRDTSTLPAGASEDHKGVDLATSVGTPLYAPGNTGTNVKIHCWRDADGGGLVADIEPADTPTLRFQALHLADCSTGLITGGKPFATTGDSGIGNAHLDWRQRDRTSGEHHHPQQHYLLWALIGKDPTATLTDVDKLCSAIIAQESNSDPRAVNADSGALGLGQVMPENLAPVDEHGKEIPQQGWDYEALGEDLTPAEFLADTDKQIKVINYQLNKLYQQQKADGHSHDEAVRRTAAAWYSGDPDMVDDPTPQHWNGDPNKEYPSVEEYSDTVLKRVK